MKSDGVGGDDLPPELLRENIKPNTISPMKPDGVGGDDLPPELLREILSRLPVKSILRFRSVCKSWYSLVSCPKFISDYSITNPNKNVLLHHFDRSIPSYLFSSHYESFMESCDHRLTYDVKRPLRIVGSCNGLICLSDNPRAGDSRATFLLWNPAIRKTVEVPYKINNPVEISGNSFSYFGFGFDPKSCDYKVLCVVRNDTKCDDKNCEIYDLSKGLWRGIGTLDASWWPYKKEQECYLNGVLHWIKHKHNVLLSFNLSDEIWREVNMPDCAEFTLDHNDGTYWCKDTGCGAFDGLIYLIRWKNGHLGEISSVWVMKEYGVTESWTKLFDIDMQSSPTFLRAELRQFHLRKNGEVLVVHHQEERYDGDDCYIVGEQELSLYNEESKICKPIFSSTRIFVDLCLYEESLVLM